MELERSSMLGGRSFLRFYSTDVAKSLLGTLRRRSGFPIIKCKEALTKHQNDLEAAETWLQEQAQKEGWAKVAKMQERQAKQGLVGVALDGSRAAMVEVSGLFSNWSAPYLTFDLSHVPFRFL